MVSSEGLLKVLGKVDFIYLVQDSSGIYYVGSPAQIERRNKLDDSLRWIKITKADIGERSVEELFEPIEKPKPAAKKTARRTNSKQSKSKTK